MIVILKSDILVEPMQSMCQKDIAMKKFMNHNQIFADIINNAVFNGMQVVKPEDLYYSYTETEYKGNRKLHNQYQDLSRFWIVHGVILAKFSIENQVFVRETEPAKLIGYDGAGYAVQLTKDNRKDDETYIYPCVTIVQYFGREHWNGIQTLHGMFRGEWSEYLKLFTPDYRINLTEVCFLDQSDLRTYRSDYRIVLDYLVQTQGKEPKDYVPSNLEMEFPEDLFPMMNALTGIDWSGKAIEQMIKEGRKITMVSAYAEVEKRGLQKGIELGKAQMKSAYAEVEKRGYDKGVEYGRAQMKSAYAEVEKRGYNKGVEYGKAQMKSAYAGITEKARKEGRSDTAVNMLKGGKLSMQDISSYTGLSMSEIEELRKSL